MVRREFPITYSITYTLSFGRCETSPMPAVDALARYDDLRRAGATDVVISEGVRKVTYADVKAGRSWVPTTRRDDDCGPI